MYSCLDYFSCKHLKFNDFGVYNEFDLSVNQS
jgi:hypothetical protein